MAGRVEHSVRVSAVVPVPVERGPQLEARPEARAAEPTRRSVIVRVSRISLLPVRPEWPIDAFSSP
jgi:hypothetical protein